MPVGGGNCRAGGKDLSVGDRGDAAGTSDKAAASTATRGALAMGHEPAFGEEGIIDE